MICRAVVVACLLLPAAANAATVEVTQVEGEGILPQDVVDYVAAEGEVNQVTITFKADGEAVTIADPGATITPAGGRTAIDDHTVRCEPRADSEDPDGGLADAQADLGDADDTLTLETPEGPEAGEVLAIGGPGEDTLTGGAARDVFVDTEADEPDTIDGGDGFDIVTYAGREEGVRSSEDDFTEIEQTVGGRGDDRLVGTDLADILIGGPGDDTLNGLDGDDTIKGGQGIDSVNASGGDDSLYGNSGDDGLFGGRGDDLLFTSETDLDRVDCGAGADIVDRPPVAAVVDEDCERVRFKGAPAWEAEPLDATANGLTFRRFATAGVATIRLTEAAEPQRRIGSGRSDKRGAVVHVALTKAGRQGIRNGIVVDVHASDTLGRTSQWRIRLRP